ncbi:MAG: hypothetical protein WC370_07575 [Dehalococcoidales bacterium]|jgi:hypothetical protein
MFAVKATGLKQFIENGKAAKKDVKELEVLLDNTLKGQSKKKELKSKTKKSTTLHKKVQKKHDDGWVYVSTGPFRPQDFEKK